MRGSSTLELTLGCCPITRPMLRSLFILRGTVDHNQCCWTLTSSQRCVTMTVTLAISNTKPRQSHSGANLAAALQQMLEDFSIQQKVSVSCFLLLRLTF